MRKVAALIAVFFFSVLLLAAACGDGEDPIDPFIGAWEGVDIVDGSSVTLTIASGADGTYDVMLFDDRATEACPTTEGSVTIIATGTLSSPTMLEYAGLLVCPSEGTDFPIEDELTYNSASDSLTDSGTFGTFNRAGS